MPIHFAYTAIFLAACSKGSGIENDSPSASQLNAGTVNIVGLDGKCLSAAGGSSADGTLAQIETCNGTAEQQWLLSNGQIVGVGGKCLDVQANTSASGTPVELWSCWGGPNQAWSIAGSEIHAIGGKCLDVRGGDPADGTPAIIWDCWGGPNQQWTLKPVSTGTSGSSTGAGDGGAPPQDDAAPPPPPVVTPNAFYVATNGSDSNPGTLLAPFQTLEKAQSAMQASSTFKTTYLRAGTYKRTATFTLGGSDSGTTWAYYPPDGPNSAALDGSASVDVVRGSHVSNSVFDGIKVQNAWDIGLEINGDGNVVRNCEMTGNHDHSEVGGWPPMLVVNGRKNRIENNYVHDVLAHGISVYAYDAGSSVDGTIVSGNVVLHACTTVNDCGAIYLNMRNTNAGGGSITVRNNFVRDYGSSSAQAEGIYLDDDTSNATVTGNIIGPPDPSRPSSWGAIIVNGGCANTFSNNIIDLGSTGAQLISGWSAPGGGGALNFDWTGPNVEKNNIVIARYAGATDIQMGYPANDEYVQGSSYPTQFGAVTANIYHNYGGGAEDTAGTSMGDSSPIHADPMCSGHLYTLAASSPAFGQIGFQPIKGGWGPPGFVIPNNTNHSCP